MDNITHSLTGALAAKVIETRNLSETDQKSQKRTLFWLLVVSANLPDIDVVFGLLGNRMFSLEHHRGITHSILIAPFFSLLPALLFYSFGRLKRFKVLWMIAFLGIIIHIFFDLVTPFGTQVFLPLSKTRYSLDWMFIIDPLFTGLLGIALFLGKIFSKRKKWFVLGGGIFVLLYLLLEIINHNLARERLEEAVRERGVMATKISTLPQPLSIFSWMGLVQTENGVLQTFFSVLNNADSLSFTIYENPIDEFVVRALQTDEAKWYTTFARHPWIRSAEEGDHHFVEFRDLQFSIDRALLREVGFTERSLPFVLRFDFSPDGGIAETTFDGRTLSKRGDRE